MQPLNYMIWILLPAFNEEHSLRPLISKIKTPMDSSGHSYKIVVVNDGSNDNTKQVLEELSRKFPIEILSHPINRGLGETERDGFEYIAARCKPEDIIIRMDCDDTHEPEYFTDLIKKIQDGYDVVITSRFQKGGAQIGVNKYRTFISYAANIFMKLLFPIPGVRDYSCGYRAYRGEIIQHAITIFGNGFIQLKGLGFTSTLETIIKLKLMGCSFAEIPFTLRYDQKKSNSKMLSGITSVGYITMALLYHWPLGGWRRFYKGLAVLYRQSKKDAINEFSYLFKKKSILCKIGGG